MRRNTRRRWEKLGVVFGVALIDYLAKIQPPESGTTRQHLGNCRLTGRLLGPDTKLLQSFCTRKKSEPDLELHDTL